MDTITKEARSRIMGKIRSKNTKPEVFIRKALWHYGIRYRKNCVNLPGSPDIYISKYKTALFVHGCFWHQHDDSTCPISHNPKSNKEFWQNKFSKNKERDERIRKELICSGIQVIIIWECTVNKMMKNQQEKDETISQIVYSIMNVESLYYEF